MTGTGTPPRSTLRAAGVIGGLASLAMLVGVPGASAAPTDAPQLSITIDDGRASTSSGDALTTAITVTNLGTTEVTGLTVTQTMPAGLVFGTADSAGVAGRDGVSWTVDLPPAGETVVRSTSTVSDTPPEQLRLATVACASATTDGPPIVCASDSDQLPAGAAADLALAADESAAAASVVRWYVAGGAVLLVAAAVLVVVLVRRRRVGHLARTTTVIALLAVVAVGTGSGTAPLVAAAPTDVVATAATGPAATLTRALATVTARTDTPTTIAQAVPTPPDPVPVDPSPSTPPTASDTQLASFTDALPSERAAIAVTTAMAQIGLPYVWGGNGPGAGDAGFDCSGLTTFSYAVAGVRLPRTAHTQYYAGPHLAADVALLPGDLVFYGTPARVHHVGMFIGEGRMVAAPTFGKPVRTSYHRWTGDDFLGSTRPAATGEPTTGVLPWFAPPAVDAASPAPTAPPVFLAPPAPPLPAPVLPAPVLPAPVLAAAVPPAPLLPAPVPPVAPIAEQPGPTPTPAAITTPTTTTPSVTPTTTAPTTTPTTTAPPTTTPPTTTPLVQRTLVPPTTTPPVGSPSPTTTPAQCPGDPTTRPEDLVPLAAAGWCTLW